MNLKLVRLDAFHDGILGEIRDTDGQKLFVCLEHAYDSGSGNGSYAPKVPAGEYKCVRGIHQLEHMTHPFETFEITSVPGHTNILFHVGNFNNDSNGCVLLGINWTDIKDGGHMITSSKLAFDKFMQLQYGVDEFVLTVI